jgi:hypothetical protein
METTGNTIRANLTLVKAIIAVVLMGEGDSAARAK